MDEPRDNSCGQQQIRYTRTKQLSKGLIFYYDYPRQKINQKRHHHKIIAHVQMDTFLNADL